MKKDQEARILGNQVLIMKTLRMLLPTSAPIVDLNVRIRDNEDFIRDYLK